MTILQLKKQIDKIKKMQKIAEPVYELRLYRCRNGYNHINRKLYLMNKMM